MRAMKDSGIEWIGEIPESWSVERNKQLFCEINDRCENGNEHTLLSVSEYYGIAPKSDKISDGEFETRAESLDGYKLCEIGDIVMNIMLAWKRSTGRTEYNGIVSPAYCVYRPIGNIDTKYYHYLFRTDIVANLFKQYSTGIIDSRLRLYPDKFLALQMIVPPLTEQQAISAYLDHQCAHIDNIIEKTKSSIEEYKKLRQAVITQAVTKGVRGDRAMKDSGIDYIGSIPEEWDIISISMAFTFLGGYAYKSDRFCAETYNQVIRIGNVKNDNLLLNSKSVYIDDEYAEESKSCLIKVDDILFTMTGTKGKQDYFYTVLINSENLQAKKLFLNQRVGCFRRKADIFMKYYCYLLKCNRIKEFIFLFETGTANQGNLGIETINRTKLHYPPMAEQQEIAAYLDQKCAEIDTLITKKEQFLTELESYKKSMIYEYVTGKKEVPSA